MPTHPHTIKAVEKALRYIELRLEGPLELAEVARTVGYSPYHFHRIFSAVTHEGLGAYILRKRLERVAIKLLMHPQFSLTPYIYNWGFNSPAAFSRAFKRYYGLSPRQFQKEAQGKSKLEFYNRKNGKVGLIQEAYVCRVNELIESIMEKTDITVVQLPEMHLAYRTHIGDCNNLGQSFNALIEWAVPYGLFTPNSKMALLYHDSHKVTAPEKIRHSVCLVLPQAQEVPPGAEYLCHNGGRHIIATGWFHPSELEKTWTALFLWMGENQYAFKNGAPSFEVYDNDPNTHPQGLCHMQLCIPIQ
jgi:AraC family transcriptional regulator